MAGHVCTCSSVGADLAFIGVQETYFRQDPQDHKRVTTKTTVEQETACFVDDGTHLGALDYLRSILHILPTHLILGAKEDFWCATPPYRHFSLDAGGHRRSFTLLYAGHPKCTASRRAI